MSITINSTQDERELGKYQKARNVPRHILSNGVYPNCQVAISAYQSLESQLAGEAGYEDLSAFSDYHSTAMAPLASHVQTIIDAMTTIMDTMEAIETDAPGTFHIELPEEEPEA